MSDLGGVFRRPFDEQAAAFRTRLGDLVPTARWDDLRGLQHDRAFMVAGATKADLLADLAAAVDKAISEGTTLDEFRRDFRDIVERHGWHGWTGEGSKGGEAWRTRVIYQTNVATSYAAGRRAQLVEGKFKYWVYRHGGSLEPRLHHLAWDGVALPPDHPFWATHAPPNGWGCSCRIFGARTEAGIRRVGGDPNKTLPDGWQTMDPATGAPKGIDKGWDHAPGASVDEDLAAMARKTTNWPFELANAFMASVPGKNRDLLAKAYRNAASTRVATRRYAERVVGERGGAPIDPRVGVEDRRTLGILTRAQQAEYGQLIETDLTDYSFVLDQSGIRHALREHGATAAEAARGQLQLLASDFGLIPQVLEAPDLVEAGGIDSIGNPLLRFTRTIGGRKVTVIMEVRGRKRRMMALKTMYVRAG